MIRIFRNLPSDPEDRIGENAKDSVKKYYLRDKDAAMDAEEAAAGTAPAEGALEPEEAAAPAENSAPAEVPSNFDGDSQARMEVSVFLLGLTQSSGRSCIYVYGFSN